MNVEHFEMTADSAEKLSRLEAVAEAAEGLSRAIRRFRESGHAPAALRAAKRAEGALLNAMRTAGKAAIRVDGQLYVDVYAHHVADEDGEGLWSVAVVPAESVLS